MQQRATDQPAENTRVNNKNFANLKIGKLLKNSLLKTDLSIRYRFLLMIEAQQVFDRGFAQRKDWSLDRFTVTSFTLIFGV